MELLKVIEDATHNSISIVGYRSEQRPFQRDSEGKRARIAVRAYFKAQARGFEPGHELDDWLAAESEVGQ